MQIQSLLIDKDKRMDTLELSINILGSSSQIQLDGLDSQIVKLDQTVLQMKKTVQHALKQLSSTKKLITKVQRQQDVMTAVGEKCKNDMKSEITALEVKNVELTELCSRVYCGLLHLPVKLNFPSHPSMGISVQKHEMGVDELELRNCNNNLFGMMFWERIECFYNLTKLTLLGYDYYGLPGAAPRLDISDLPRIKNNSVKELIVFFGSQDIMACIPIILKNMSNLETLEILDDYNTCDMIATLQCTSHKLKQFKIPAETYSPPRKKYIVKDMDLLIDYCRRSNIELIRR
jgi:hypothetical protein